MLRFLPINFPRLRKKIVICGVGRHGILGKGKASDHFWGRFERELASRGCELVFASDGVPIPKSDAVVAVYNEEEYCNELDLRESVLRLEQSIGKTPLVHSGALARVLCDKLEFSREFAPLIPMPQLMGGTKASTKTFSNPRTGSHERVHVRETGEGLDGTRYNTEYVDTCHTYRGADFYVALRAMCVGRRMVSLFLRARPISDGDASVHSVDTPVDPNLINELYSRVVEPRRAEIESICHRIGTRLGLGFFAHDLLPERETGRTLVCESGFKFDDRLLRSHLSSLKGVLSFSDDLFEPEARVAETFLSELKKWKSKDFTRRVAEG